MVYQVEHFINGQRAHGKDDTVHELINPANNRVQGKVYYASQAMIEQAIEEAAAAFTAWSQTTVTKRAQILFRFKALIEDNIKELAALITKEHGKSLNDSIGSIQRGLAVVEYACGIPDHLKGAIAMDVGTGIDCYSMRQPLGVCVGITPFNFPAMIPLWMFPIAIACGNTFVLKPSERDPSCGLRLAELFLEAGLPKGVLNVIHGGKEVVDRLISHPKVAAISFVGSSPIAEYIYRTATALNKRVQAFGGAKNHCLVMPDADLPYTVDAIMGAAYGSAGERCMAISVVIAVGNELADYLVESLAPKVANLTIGEGSSQVDMGPLVTKAHLAKVKNYIDIGVKEGAKLVVDGRLRAVDSHGNFLGASLFDEVTPQMRIYKEEIFGPVLVIVRVQSFEEGLQLINEHEFGNGTAIFTNDPQYARRFSKEVKAGMVGINIPIPVPVAQFSFGGWKRSMFGDIHLHGPEGIQFYTRHKTVTMKWPKQQASQPTYHMPTME